jgi:hypothetical protein
MIKSTHFRENFKHAEAERPRKEYFCPALELRSLTMHPRSDKTTYLMTPSRRPTAVVVVVVVVVTIALRIPLSKQ